VRHQALAAVAVALVIAVGAAVVWRQRAVPAGPYRTFTAEVMATTVRAVLPDTPGAEADAAAVFAVFTGVDRGMSEWREGSPLARVNRAAGGAPVPVPADLLALLRRSVEIAATTGGAFDPTWAALWGVWDFRAAAPALPAAAEVARRAALVDYRRLEIDPAAGTVRLPEPGMQLGLGGIAKGWALDRAAAVLRERRVGSFLIQSGGQVLAGGRRETAAGARPWRVGIRDPRGGPDDYFAWLDLADASASTSGDYESFFVLDGVRYHHVLDPRTGWPARGVTGVTVVSPDATLADALSTALMVLGPEHGLALAERLPEVEAVVVGEAGELGVTRGLAGELELVHPPAAAAPRALSP
jgi:thiamine biosynthesis lipoprotein